MLYKEIRVKIVQQLAFLASPTNSKTIKMICEWVQLIIPDEQPCFDLTQISTLIEQLCWDCLNVYLCFLLDGRYV